MDNIIPFMALFSLTATAAQVSLFRYWWQQVVLALLIAAITYWFYPRAIQFSSSDIAALLADAKTMLDMSVILVVEAVLMLILALFMLREIYQEIRFPWKSLLWLQYLPMASAVGVLCFYQAHIYQQGLTLAFEQTALVYGGTVAITVLALARFLKFLVPMRVLRLELKLAMHAALIVIAVAVSVLTATYPYRNSIIEPNLLELGAVTLLFAVLAVVGYFRHQRNIQKIFKQAR